METYRIILISSLVSFLVAMLGIILALSVLSMGHGYIGPFAILVPIKGDSGFNGINGLDGINGRDGILKFEYTHDGHKVLTSSSWVSIIVMPNGLFCDYAAYQKGKCKGE